MTPERANELADEIRLAGKAREVLQHEALKLAFSQVEAALLNGMRSAAIADDKLRLRLLDKYESLHALLQCLQSMADTGMMAEEELKQKSIAEKVKEFVFN